MIVSLRGEALIRRLETEKLKFLIAKLRREQYGPLSERGRLLVEQLELAIADIEESQGAAEAEADIAAPETAAAACERRAPRSPRPKLPENLPVERVVYPVPCACDRCGGARLRKLGELVELCGRMGDDEGVKAAYRGGCRACQNLPRERYAYGDLYQHRPASSAC